jgi:hypothetical protein
MGILMQHVQYHPSVLVHQEVLQKRTIQGQESAPAPALAAAGASPMPDHLTPLPCHHPIRVSTPPGLSPDRALGQRCCPHAQLNLSGISFALMPATSD